MNINLGQMLQQAQISGMETGAKLMSAAGSDSAVTKLLGNLLENGSSFEGTVLDIRGGQAQIQVGNDVFSAMLWEGTTLNIGEKVTFVVKEQQGDKIVLRTADEAQTQNQILSRILEEASLPVTKRNLQAVEEMMKHNLPVDKASVAEMGRTLHLYGDASVETIVGLKSHQMPVSNETIVQYEKYQNGEANLGKEIEGLLEELRSLPEGDKNVQNFFRELSDGLRSVLQEQESTAEPGKMQQTLQEIPGEMAKESVTQLQQKQEALSQNVQEILTAQEGTVKKMSAEDGQKIVTQLEKALFLEAAQLENGGEEKVRQYYKKLGETLDKLMDSLEANQLGDSKLMSAAKDMKNNMSFMQDFNQMSAYVQLPVKIGGEERNGELYILNNRRQKPSTKEGVTAFMHLDLEYLGATDVRMALKENGLTTKFTLQDKESVALVSEHLEELQKRLEQAGYHVKISVEETVEEKPPFEKILEADRPKQTVKRYAFDVRA